MPRKKRELLALPGNAKKDLKTIAGIMDKYAGEAEDVIKDAFAWVKKHKLLVAVAAGLLFLWRYWLAEQPENSDDF